MHAVSVPLQQDQQASLDPHDPANHEHFSQRGNWLRAAVLGANDGLVTVGALMTGIGATSNDQHQLLLSAVAALTSGARLRLVDSVQPVQGALRCSCAVRGSCASQRCPAGLDVAHWGTC
jgi:VIT family